MNPQESTIRELEAEWSQIQASNAADLADLIDQKGLATILGVSERSLEGWRASGQGPKFVKIGRRVRYRVSDVREWMESRTHENTTQASAA